VELGGEGRGTGWGVGSNRSQGYEVAEESNGEIGGWMASLWPGFAECRGSLGGALLGGKWRFGGQVERGDWLMGC